ncbi:MAG: Protein translocase subunit SecD, partial [Pseudomonadota bacterium]
MLHFSRGKTIAILLACLLGILGAIPNFFSRDTIKNWPTPFNKQIVLGLDLQGGAHFLIGMDTTVLQKETLEKLRIDVRDKIVKAGLAPVIVSQPQGTVLRVQVNPDKLEGAMREARTFVQPIENAIFGGTQGNTLEVKRVDGATNAFTIGLTDAGIRDKETRGIDAAISTLRRRLDPTGTSEMTIVRQGRDRILVQIPGIEDARLVQEYRDRIKETAKMTFHLVHRTMTAREARNGSTPPGYSIFPSTDRTGNENPTEVIEELIQTNAILSGEQLVEAQAQQDPQRGGWLISFRFNQGGALTFGRITSENVGYRFAVVLDGKVITAPVIQTAILGGSGVITGNFTNEQANRTALLLRSGALPAPLTIIEERTVGPSLGADTIKKGINATIIGTLCVVAFMLFAYGLFGVFALIAVAINIGLIIAGMTWMGATMTLPGIAGILLTVGMSVDSNVLVYERMREELRNNRPTIQALEAGFDRALSSIVDGNLTTLIAGILMFALGSGPIKGFAVTLCLGILTTIFTAFMVTRLLTA